MALHPAFMSYVWGVFPDGRPVKEGEEARGWEWKAWRALEHLQTLHAEVDDWLKGDPYRITEEVDPDTGENVQRIWDIEDPPTRFSLIIGDFIQTTRSALDHIVWELSVRQAPRPIKDHERRKIQFPIFGDEPVPPKVRAFRFLSDKQKAFIESVQPCNSPASYVDQPLWHLHELSNLDKHRTIALTVTRSVGTVFDFTHATSSGRFPIVSETSVPIGPLEDGAEIKRFLLDPGAKVNVKLQPVIQPGFPDSVGIGERAVLYTLEQIWRDAIHWVMRDLASGWHR